MGDWALSSWDKKGELSTAVADLSLQMAAAPPSQREKDHQELGCPQANSPAFS